MTTDQERLVSYILKCIEHGRLTPEKTEHRLQRIIDREICRPLDQPANTELIDLCSALILKLHRRMQGSGGRAWVEHAAAQPMRVIDASGIERLVRIAVREETKA